VAERLRKRKSTGMAPRRLLPVLALAVAAFACAFPLQAQEAPDPAARPELAKPLRDPDFGVRTTAPGLERVVEMYQWQAVDGGYARDWSAQPVDSSGFPPGHENPALPLHGKRWLPDRVTVDGHPLDAAVLDELGQWKEFRPSFSALPGNLSATFQPEGDGLGSAENPLAPEVGDLRIHWRERVLPPLGDRIELQAGTWKLRPDAPPVVEGEAQDRTWSLGWLPLLAGGVGLLVLAALLARKKR
jgi:hypothetical protein